MTEKKPRVVLADDHAMVLEGFRSLLSPHCDIVGMVEDGRALLDCVSQVQPDVVVLDVSMPLLNGIEATRRLKQMTPCPKIICLTMHADRAYVSEAFKAGVDGYVLKKSVATELLQAIQIVMKEQFFLTPHLTKGLVDSLTHEPRPSPHSKDILTGRQREVLQLVAEGKTVKEIAVILDISPKTVAFHKGEIMTQLNLHTTAELTKYALEHGLTSPE